MSWSEGRYQARKYHRLETAQNLVSTSPSDLYVVSVVHPKVELRTLGIILEADGPADPLGGGDVASIIALDRLNKNAAWAAAVGNRVELKTLTFPLDYLQYSIYELSLDPNAADIHTKAAFPVAYYGDRLIIELKTQGVNGSGGEAQSARLFIKYRELENRTDEVDGPTA